MSVIVLVLTLASQIAGFGRPMCLSLGLIRLLLDENCTTNSYLQFPFHLHSWNKVSARSHKQKKGNTNTQPSIAFTWLMTGCNLTPPKKTRGVSPIAIPLSTAMNTIKYYQLRSIIVPWAKPTKRLTTLPGI